MGPLQYMAISYESTQFNAEIAPELVTLCRSGVIRLIDLLLVRKDSSGTVTSLEGKDVISNYEKIGLAPRGTGAEWFAQDDVDVAGETLPNGASIVLLLFEHLWAVGLESSVRRANGCLYGDGISLPGVAEQIEHILTDFALIRGQGSYA